MTSIKGDIRKMANMAAPIASVLYATVGTRTWLHGKERTCSEGQGGGKGSRCQERESASSRLC